MTKIESQRSSLSTNLISSRFFLSIYAFTSVRVWRRKSRSGDWWLGDRSSHGTERDNERGFNRLIVLIVASETVRERSKHVAGQSPGCCASYRSVRERLPGIFRAKECPRGRSFAFPAGNVTFLPGIFAVCSDVSRYYEENERKHPRTFTNIRFFPPFFFFFFFFFLIFQQTVSCSKIARSAKDLLNNQNSILVSWRGKFKAEDRYFPNTKKTNRSLDRGRRWRSGQGEGKQEKSGID